MKNPLYSSAICFVLLLTPVRGTEPVAERIPRIDIWYGDNQPFGHLGGHPQRWVNVLGSVSHPELIESVNFHLNSGELRPLSFREDKKRIARDGDFNVEILRSDLQVGENSVMIVAKTTGGMTVRKVVNVIYHDSGANWPLPYSIEWAQVAQIHDAVQVIDGKWKKTKDGIRSIERYYDRVIAFGDSSWRDYEVSTTLTVHALTPPTQGGNSTNVTHVAIALRWPGHDPDGRQPTVKWYPLGATAEFRLGGDLSQCRWRIFDGQREFHRESSRRRVIEFERRYSLKHRVETDSAANSRYRVKLWPAAEPEPPVWDFERTEPNDDVSSGSALLIAHHSDVTFGNVTVVPLMALESTE